MSERCAVAGCDQVDGLTWVVDYKDACRAKPVCELGLLGHNAVEAIDSERGLSLPKLSGRDVVLAVASLLLGVVLTLALRWTL